jgi:hypothetical protein
VYLSGHRSCASIALAISYTSLSMTCSRAHLYSPMQSVDYLLDTPDISARETADQYDARMRRFGRNDGHILSTCCLFRITVQCPFLQRANQNDDLSLLAGLFLRQSQLNRIQDSKFTEKVRSPVLCWHSSVCQTSEIQRCMLRRKVTPRQTRSWWDSAKYARPPSSLCVR